MTSREYMIEVGSGEDHRPVKQFLSQEGLAPEAAPDDWKVEVESTKLLAATGLFLMVRTDRSRTDLETLLSGHGWDLRVLADRPAQSYPA